MNEGRSTVLSLELQLKHQRPQGEDPVAGPGSRRNRRKWTSLRAVATVAPSLEDFIGYELVASFRLPYALPMHPPQKRQVTPATIDRLREGAIRVFSQHPKVIAVYLYGSAARGEPAADLDVAVLCEGSCVPLVLEAFASRLQQEAAPAGPDLDVRQLTGSSPRYRINVLRDGRLLYERDRQRRLEFEARSMSEWLDFKPTWERMRQRLFERWTHG